MSRPITFAIRVTFASGRDAFVRQGGVMGRGPIATFRTKAQADEQAAFLREGLDAGDTVVVFERSHGRTFPEAREAQVVGSGADTVSDGENKR